jgi:hypothetical protein
VPRLYAPFTSRASIPNGSFTRTAPSVRPIAGPCRQGTTMLDILLLGLGLGAFALMAAYVAGCDRV